MKPTSAGSAPADHLQLIARQKWTILVTVVVVVVVAAIFLLQATPVYRASATLLAKTDSPQVSPRDDMPMVAEALKLDGGRSVETQKRLVKSWPVVARALRQTGDRLPIDEVMKRLKVATFKDMDVIEVSVEDTSPVQAVRLANGVAASYISLSQLAARESACTAKEFARSQLAKVRAELGAAENRLRAFKRHYRIASLSDETKAKIESISKLQASAEEASAAAGPARARADKLERLLGDQPERQTASVITERNPVVDQLAGDVATLEAQQAGLLAEVTEDNPAAKSIAARIAKAREWLRAEATRVPKTEESALNPVRQSLLETLCEARAESLVAEKTASNLMALLRSRERELGVLPNEQLALARLERDVTTAERLYASLTQKYEEFRLAEAIRLASARLVEPAAVPLHPVKPRKLLVLTSALMMGLLLGLALASLRDRFDDSIRSDEQIPGTTALPVLARVPDLGKSAPAFALSSSSGSMAAEAYRILRTNLRFSAVDSDIRTLLVASGLPREGKTTVATNLAAALTAEGKKVILVEADLRRPTLESKALVKPESGLTELLVGQKTLEESITPSQVDGLDLMTCGRVPPNPSELLASNRMRQLLDDLSHRYDVVIVDSPPLCLMADAGLLASIVDATLLVTSISLSRRGALEHSLSVLENAKARVIGTVINRVPRTGGGYYRRGYYSHYYYSSKGNGRDPDGKDVSSETRTAA